MTNVRLSNEALASPVGRELKQLLDRILEDDVIQPREVFELKQWIDARLEHSEQVPALSYLNRAIQVILEDEIIESVEWAMLRAAIEKVLPERGIPPIILPNVSAQRIESGPSMSSHGLGDEWVIVDTETSGLFAPIYAVEIAAQKMKGWMPAGESFRILLNHDVELEPAAVATHGYTRSFLRKHGLPPEHAHAQFAQYAGGLEMVSHNLAYDFNRVLEPEWGRLGFEKICPAGFCTVMLSRRCLPEVSSASLDSLSSHFRLGTPTHHAGDDVRITVRLVTEILAPRLRNAGFASFQETKAFSRRTPLAACHKIFGGKAGEAAPRVKRPITRARKFKRFLQEITCDGAISNAEFFALREWLDSEGCASEESCQAADLVEKIMQDGFVTSGELENLSRELEKLASS